MGANEKGGSMEGLIFKLRGWVRRFQRQRRMPAPPTGPVYAEQDVLQEHLDPSRMRKYLDRRLSREKTQRARAHLLGCESCSKKLANMSSENVPAQVKG